MKKTVRLVTFIMLMCMASILLCACVDKKDPIVLKESDTFIIINANENVSEDDTLVDYMTKLKESGELDFAMKNGMITSVNGIENAADFSQCWMLYTSDTSNANDAWGTVEYNGKIYGSATLGAELLKIKSGALYIWVYQTF